nr:MAG TPA: hypothetical protein [Caudoviricetes sp.]
MQSKKFFGCIFFLLVRKRTSFARKQPMGER